MRPPSLLLPVGAVVACVGINQPVVTIGVHLRRATLVERDFGASSDQRAYLLVAAAVAVGAWILPKVLPRTNPAALVLGLLSLIGVAVAAARGWLIATDGPHALQTGDTGFLEKGALDLLDRLESAGILVLDPAPGLWVITAGATLMLLGLVLALRPTGPSSVRPYS